MCSSFESESSNQPTPATPQRITHKPPQLYSPVALIVQGTSVRARRACAWQSARNLDDRALLWCTAVAVRAIQTAAVVWRLRSPRLPIFLPAHPAPARVWALRAHGYSRPGKLCNGEAKKTEHCILRALMHPKRQ